MKIIKDITKIKIPSPSSITIGFFDGIHLGHQKIFETLNKKKQSGKSVVITFENHPSEIINPKQKPILIHSLEKRLKLIKKYNIDYTVVLKFTNDLKNTTYLEFLKQIKNHIDFSYLVLGKDASFGSNKNGGKAQIIKLEKSLTFKTIYIDLVTTDKSKISSTLIRELIKKKSYNLIAKLINRRTLL